MMMVVVCSMTMIVRLMLVVVSRVVMVRPMFVMAL